MTRVCHTVVRNSNIWEKIENARDAIETDQEVRRTRRSRKRMKKKKKKKKKKDTKTKKQEEKKRRIMRVQSGTG